MLPAFPAANDPRLTPLWKLVFSRHVEMMTDDLCHDPYVRCCSSINGNGVRLVLDI